MSIGKGQIMHRPVKQILIGLAIIIVLSSFEIPKSFMGSPDEASAAMEPLVPTAIASSILVAMFVALIALALVYVPRHRVAEVTDIAKRLELENEVRKGLAQTIGGVVVLIGLWNTWQTLQISRESQIADRFAHGLEQLGSEKLEVRLGGIYDLEQIVRDSPRDDWTIVEILSAFIRKNATWNPERRTSDPPPDIQASLTVLGRRCGSPYRYPLPRDHCRSMAFEGEQGQVIWLTNTDLRRTNLNGAHLEKGDLAVAHLEKAFLLGTHLEGAVLISAHLEQGGLISAHLEGATLIGAHLENASLIGAHLQRAHLEDAILSGAHLENAILSGAHLERVNLEGATLSGAHLEGADLRTAVGLTQEQIRGAIVDKSTLLPWTERSIFGVPGEMRSRP